VPVFSEKYLSETTYKDMNASLLCIHMLFWCHVLSFC